MADKTCPLFSDRYTKLSTKSVSLHVGTEGMAPHTVPFMAPRLYDLLPKKDYLALKNQLENLAHHPSFC